MNNEKQILATGHTYYRNENGDLHREDGPALIWNKSKIKWYYLNGVEMKKSHWEKEVFKLKLQRLKDL